ncbi:uncharacterized protein LOC119383875 isoform X1 [Rhipicephalus sanguineus]|uniref:uncharacterized protein LOC119383875 isoform X1 n=1 Tax=Rhipicephalus sanguineus TaxID=34632 RepID=UPI0020C1E5CE|nr:uncharacterized protein LOC119383875 isoform X1 [Rhipicephalus sanguineus]
MATYTALMLLALAVAVASLDLHSLIENPDLSPFQDPSRFIWTNSSVYLLRVSVPTGTRQNISEIPIPCVRSRYWSNATGITERSLDVYNKTNHSDYRSTNISLTKEEGEENWQTFLKVYHENKEFVIMNLTDGTKIAMSATLNYTFLVLFSDANCLILAKTLKTESAQRPWLRCSMWLTESRITKPPKCCQFIFDLLCAYNVETVDVFDKKCLNGASKKSKSA